jgi:hypothetical protein
VSKNNRPEKDDDLRLWAKVLTGYLREIEQLNKRIAELEKQLANKKGEQP